MSKGHKGETCSEAIRSSLEPGEIISADVLFRRVRDLGTWTDDTIWQHLIAHVANHPAARQHYVGFEPFLYLHEDGRYELFDPGIHPIVRFVSPPGAARESRQEPEPQTEMALDFPEGIQESSTEPDGRQEGQPPAPHQ